MEGYRKKSLKEVLPGEMILHPIYRPDGLLFLNRYKMMTNSILANIRRQFPSDITVLTVSNSSDLEAFEEQKIYQEKEFQNDLEDVVEALSQYIQASLTIEHYQDERSFISPSSTNVDSFEKFYYSPVWTQLDQVFESPHILSRVPIVKKLLFETLKSEVMLESLYSKMKSYHDVLKIHSINTSITSLMIGLSLELRDEELVELAISTLFADIGFTEYPKTKFIYYLNHSKRTELLSSHIKQSVEVISGSEFCRKKDVVYGILEHHERFDGNGFPNGKAGDEIHLYAKIIAIAQSYDELVGGYIAEQSVAVYQALLQIWDQGGKLFDKKILHAFITRSSLFKLNQKVTLPNFQTGTIVGFENYLDHPLLPVIQREDGVVINLYKR
ncbi:HD-GYP domain-containing protein [Robertmurraya sp. P23]|uniref:HD-GYP domain-containing protein n=1 Tax=Robertmurraya sp. P23 TaxID=3436931 RepID=UPI003D981A65